MTQDELIRAIHNETGAPRHLVYDVLQMLASLTVDELKEGQPALIPGLGKMVVVTRAARMGRNPKTGEPVQIPERKVVVFKASKALQDALNPAR